MASPAHLETGAVLDVALGALGAAVDVVRAADGVRLRAAREAARAERTARGRRAAARLPVRTLVVISGSGGCGRAGQRHRVAAAAAAGAPQRQAAQQKLQAVPPRRTRHAHATVQVAVVGCGRCSLGYTTTLRSSVFSQTGRSMTNIKHW